MTTRAYLSDGETVFDYDEETQAHPTAVDGLTVVRRQFTGPTPPKGASGEAPAGETVAEQRDRLRAELASLGDET